MSGRADLGSQVRPHFGMMTVALREAGLVNSIPPAYFGDIFHKARQFLTSAKGLTEEKAMFGVQHLSRDGAVHA